MLTIPKHSKALTAHAPLFLPSVRTNIKYTHEEQHFPYLGSFLSFFDLADELLAGVRPERQIALSHSAKLAGIAYELPKLPDTKKFWENPCSRVPIVPHLTTVW